MSASSILSGLILNSFELPLKGEGLERFSDNQLIRTSICKLLQIKVYCNPARFFVNAGSAMPRSVMMAAM